MNEIQREKKSTAIQAESTTDSDDRCLKCGKIRYGNWEYNEKHNDWSIACDDSRKKDARPSDPNRGYFTGRPWYEKVMIK